MVRLHNFSSENSLGDSFKNILTSYKILNNQEIIINSNSDKTQTIMINTLKDIVVYDESIVFYGLHGINDFLNLNNILSISVLDGDSL